MSNTNDTATNESEGYREMNNCAGDFNALNRRVFSVYAENWASTSETSVIRFTRINNICPHTFPVSVSSTFMFDLELPIRFTRQTVRKRQRGFDGVEGRQPLVQDLLTQIKGEEEESLMSRGAHPSESLEPPTFFRPRLRTSSDPILNPKRYSTMIISRFTSYSHNSLCYTVIEHLMKLDFFFFINDHYFSE